MIKARDIIERVARRVLTPRTILSVDAWAAAHRVLTQASSEQGAWRNERTPYLVEPMRAATDASVGRIVLMFASQTGKTELLFNIIGHAACERPRPGLYAISTHAMAVDYNQTRLTPAIHASSAWSEATGEIKTQRIDFERMSLKLVGAHKANNLKGRPIGLACFDEIDEWPDGHLAMGRERLKTFADSLEIDTSTPTDEGVGIDAEYANSDKRVYYVPCPHCETHHKLVFENLRWDKRDDGGQPDADTAERTACMVCPECGCEINDHHKPGMLRRGVWLPAGERPAGRRDTVSRTAEAFDGSPVPVAGRAEKPASKVRGYQLSALYSPFTSFGEVARAFAEDGYRVTREFVNGWLGEAWRAVADRIERSELDVLKVERRHGGFALRSVPEATPLLVTTIDVQQDRCYLMTVGYGAHMAAWSIVDFAEIDAPEGERLVSLDERIEKLGYVCGGRRLTPIAIGVDTGHRTDEVYAFVRRMRRRGWDKAGRRIWPVKGDTAPSATQSWRPLRVENYPGSKTKMPAHMQLTGLLVNTGLHKGAIHGDIKSALKEPGSVLIAEDTPARVLDGLVSEQREVIKRRGQRARIGQPTIVWAKRPGRIGEFNHPLDLAVYARAIGHREKLDLADEQRVQRFVGGAERAKG